MFFLWQVIPSGSVHCLTRLDTTTTTWKVSKYGVISGPYFPVFSSNTGQYGPEIIPYLDPFHVVVSQKLSLKIVAH